jgi:transcriptional regulator with XRE-family HTH domain
VPKQIGADKHRESRTLAQAFGAELTRLRLDRGWSQQKLADALGYTERYIGQLERGVKSPTQRTLADIAEVFSTKPSVILRAAERRQQHTAER